jgi:hypothetical protein
MKVFLFHFDVLICNVVYTHLVFQGIGFNLDSILIKIGVLVIGFLNVDVWERYNM